MSVEDNNKTLGHNDPIPIPKNPDGIIKDIKIINLNKPMIIDGFIFRGYSGFIDHITPPPEEKDYRDKLTFDTDQDTAEKEEMKRVRRENENLRVQNKQLESSQSALQNQVKALEVLGRTQQSEISSLIEERQELIIENRKLTDRLRQKEQAEKVRIGVSVDRLDPQGYCKTLGLDPKFLRSMSPSKLDALILSLYRAHALAFHPDTGGDIKAMQKINEAYEYLKNPGNRRNYGSSF